MQVNLFGFDVTIRRGKNKNNPLTMDDVRQINSDRLNHIRDVPLSELKRRVDEITVTKFSTDPAAIERANDILDEFGIVVIPNFLDPDLARRFASDLNVAYEDFVSSLDGEYVENESVLIQKGGVHVSGYDNLANYPKPVIQIRQGQDQGMVDIFNADRLTPKVADEVREPFERSAVLKLLRSSAGRLHPHNLNCYINRGITNTRGFHADTYSEKLKGFIYLTDVYTLDDGPYTYVKSSHVESPYRRANQLLSSALPNETEAPLVDETKVVPVLAPRGSLVISDQAGFHRGFPQSEHGERMIAVMSYGARS